MMRSQRIRWWGIILLAAVLPCSAAAAKKRSMSVGEARRAVGAVAAYQGFPSNFRLDRAGSIEVDEEFFHVFVCYMSKNRTWRTLVFANSGTYLGYYATVDQPVDLYKDALVYPGESYSAEFGDDAEGDYDTGDARIIRFSAKGPPDEVQFEKKTYTFISSPARIRPDDPGYRFIQVANRVADALNHGRYLRVRDDFSTRSLQRISEQDTENILTAVREKLGRIKRVGSPWVQSEDTAVLPVAFEHAVGGLKLLLTDRDEIDGMWVLPFNTAFPDMGTNQVPLSLPFDNKWRVLWGGDGREQSKYFGSRVGHHAREFVISSRFGKTYRGDGRHNKDYMSFGQAVRAPAAGTVVAVIRGVQDNRPHSPNPFDRLGNAVMIQHSTNEYSVIGHLKHESIRVAPGAEVKARQLIAQCGNSGDSSQPSIYFHLQDSPKLLSGSGYRPAFSNIYLTRDGKLEISPLYSPVRGEFVQHRSVLKKTAASRDNGESEAGSQ